MVQSIALDIALLVPSELEGLCIRFNTAEGASPFSDFRKPDNHPHITLAMGVFPAAYIEAIYAAETATREMVRVDSDELWEPNTSYWIDGFKDKRSDDYNPHISLKCRNAALSEKFDAREFVVDRLVIARVGNYCSCRDILREIILKYSKRHK